MTFEIEAFGSVCELKAFLINGKEADSVAFVDKYDHSPETGDDYGCGDMRADVKAPNTWALERYGITPDEFKTIAEAVAEKVSWGCCGLCI